MEGRSLAVIGVLVLAHGGSPQWNRTVADCVKGAHLSCPYKIVFGMGDSDTQVYQSAVNALCSQGAKKLVSVPLLVSSHSEVYRQYEFLLRLRSSPGFSGPVHEHGSPRPEGRSLEPASPLKLDVPVVLAPALDSCPFMADLLFGRVLEVSRAPVRETVILVAHGPNDESDNLLWGKSLESWTKTLRERGRFREVVSLTLRDDAPEPIRGEATMRLRRLVAESAHEGGEALIVPVLVASGGIEGGIFKRLEGLPFKMSRALLPDPRVSRWIRDQVEKARLEDGA
jgi:sirohydrochlorin cobaltochelatase